MREEETLVFYEMILSITDSLKERSMTMKTSRIIVPDNMVTNKRDGACAVVKLTKSIIGVRLDCMNKFACMGLHVHGFEMRCGMCCGCAVVSEAMWRSLIRLCF